MIAYRWLAAASMLLMIWLTGCRSAPREAGFADVRRLTSERTGHRVHWNTGGADDRAVAASVRDLLSDELTIEEAVQIALLNNQDLQAVYEDLGVAQANLLQAGLLRNPVFEASVGIPIDGGQTELALGVAQDFIDLMLIPLRKKLAAAQLEAAKYLVADAVLDLSSRTQAAYYRLQSEEQLLEMLRQVLAASEASYDVAKRQRAAGNITELELDEERAQYEQTKLELAAEEAAIAADRERLNVLMGLWGSDTRWRIAVRLPEVPEEELDLTNAERQAVRRSLDLAIVRESFGAQARRLGIANATALFVDAEVGVEAEREEGEWEVGPTISVPIPLFDRGQGRVANARAEWRRARARYTATAVRVRSSVRVAVQELRAARDRAIYYRRVLLPLRGRIVDHAQLRYNAMQIGPAELLHAKQAQINAGREYIQSLQGYWLARTRMRSILAGHLPIIEIDPQFPTGVTGTSRTAADEGGH
jgi:cobalt-zinc-cadmium efflux system outer membrane protein